MKRFNADETHQDNTNRSTTPLSVYHVHADATNQFELKNRRDSTESNFKNENATRERFKTIVIYILSLVIVLLVCALCYSWIIVYEDETDVLEPVVDQEFHDNLPKEQRIWYKNGFEEIRDSVRFKHSTRKAKNVILFVGDGMGVSTVTAARIYKYGEEGRLSWESFPHTGLLKTYCADKQVCDSASTATALFCGVKSNYETSGVDSSVLLNDCDASLDKSNQVNSILKWAQDANMGTGFVTTTRVVHATPSALYAHVPNRKWECEAKIKPEDREKGCKDIARQMIEDEPGRSINVIMGGGRQCLVSNVTDTSDDPVDHWSCQSKDGRDLVSDWSTDKQNRSLRHAVVTNNEELGKLDHKNTDYVLGIFANGHLKYDHERDRGPKGMPSLMNMTEKTLKILKQNKNGFVLVVEGGMIDQAHHRGHAHRALSEAAAMDDAVKRTLEIMQTELEDTLIIVTADHSHSLTINGYPERGNNILGIARHSKFDDVPYTTLLYATGGPDSYQTEMGSDGKVHRRNPINDNTTGYTYIQQAAIQTDENAHTGSDVTIHATGPMAYLVQRVHEQNFVAHLISFAAQIGHFRKK